MATLSNTSRKYNQAAPNWHRKVHDLGYVDAYRNLIRTTIPHAETGQICDLGAGSGQMSLAYCDVHKAPEFLTLVDPARDMLGQAKKRLAKYDCNPTRLAIGLEEMDPGRHYSLILSAHMIETCADTSKAIAKISTHLVRGGKALIVISKPHICQWFIWLKWQHKWFSTCKIHAMAHAAGLVPEGVYPLSGRIPSRTSLGYLFHKPK